LLDSDDPDTRESGVLALYLAFDDGEPEELIELLVELDRQQLTPHEEAIEALDPHTDSPARASQGRCNLRRRDADGFTRSRALTLLGVLA
jgi:hypothetical protein